MFMEIIMPFATSTANVVNQFIPAVHGILTHICLLVY